MLTNMFATVALPPYTRWAYGDTCWKRCDFYWWLEVRHGGREQRAAASNGAPDGVEQVRKALFELVGQVVDEPAYT
jgi:hypothetical protein